MVSMDGTDCTSVAGFNENSTATSITYTNRYDKFDYEPDYIAEEIKAVRFGWCNPRKIPIHVQHIQKPIKIQIRNKLPRTKSDKAY